MNLTTDALLVDHDTFFHYWYLPYYEVFAATFEDSYTILETDKDLETLKNWTYLEYWAYRY